MIPLTIIVVLGSIAFLVGFKGYLSDDRDETDRNPKPSSTPAKSAPGPRSVSDTSSTERATQLNTLRGTIVASDRLVSRASHERAVLVQFIDLHAPGTISIQEFLSNLRADYSRRVTFVARHLPTSDQAHMGATALEAADRQGCFLPFLEAITLGPDAQELPRLHTSVTTSEGLREHAVLAALAFRGDSPRPSAWRLLRGQDPAGGFGYMGSPTFTKRTALREQDACVAVEVTNPPIRHRAVCLCFQPPLVQGTETVDGFRVVPPLGAPVLPTRAIYRLQSGDDVFHPLDEISRSNRLSFPAGVFSGFQLVTHEVCPALMRSTVEPIRAVITLSRNQGTVRTMVPPPLEVFTHARFIGSSESWETDMMSRRCVCTDREDPFFDVEELRTFASY